MVSLSDFEPSTPGSLSSNQMAKWRCRFGDTDLTPAAAQGIHMDLSSAWPLRTPTCPPFFTTEQSCWAPPASAGQAFSSSWE